LTIGPDIMQPLWRKWNDIIGLSAPQAPKRTKC